MGLIENLACQRAALSIFIIVTSGPATHQKGQELVNNDPLAKSGPLLVFCTVCKLTVKSLHF